MISINGKKKVTGAHGIALDTDEDIAQCDPDKLDMLVSLAAARRARRILRHVKS